MWAWVSFPPLVSQGSSVSSPQSEGCACYPQAQLHLLPGPHPTTDKALTKPCRARHAGAQLSLPAVSGKHSGSLSSQDKHSHSCVPSLALGGSVSKPAFPHKSSFHTPTHLYTLAHTCNLHLCIDIIPPTFAHAMRSPSHTYKYTQANARSHTASHTLISHPILHTCTFTHTCVHSYI